MSYAKTILVMAFYLAGCTAGTLRDKAYEGDEEPLSQFSVENSVPIATPQVSFVVEEFGAIADGVTDSTQAIQDTINAAIASNKPAEVVLAAGTYYLACTGPIPATTQDWCLITYAAKNLTIRGQGSAATQLVIGNPFKGLMYVMSADGLAVQSFAVDYAKLPFTQGTIAQVNASQNFMDVDLHAGYPSFSEPQIAMALSTSFAMVFDPSQPKLKEGVHDNIFGLTASPVSGNRWRISFPTWGSSLFAGISVGDRFVLPLRLSYGFVSWSSANIALTDVTIYTGPGGATFWNGTKGGIAINGLQVRRKPGTDRLLSTAADAMHLSDNPATLSITNCMIEGMGDDAINIYTNGNTVRSVASSTQFVLPVYVPGFAAGHSLQVVDTNSQTVKAVSQITSYVLSADQTTATVTINPGIGNLAVSDTVYNISLASPGAYIADNTFGSYRGSFRLRSHAALYTNNTIQDTINAEIYIASDITQANGAILWNEGPSLISGATGPTLTNNVVNGVRGDAGLIPLRGIKGEIIPETLAGNVEGIGGDSVLRGWACLKGQESPLQVHVYAGGGYPTGQFIGSALANVSRESTVGAACGSSSSNHGFEFVLTPEIQAGAGGKTLYVYAIDFSVNPLVNGSGVHVVPGAAIEQKCEVLASSCLGAGITPNVPYDDFAGRVDSHTCLDVRGVDYVNYCGNTAIIKMTFTDSTGVKTTKTYPLAVLGAVDGIFGNSQGEQVLAGWTCIKTQEASIPVNVYVGGPYGTGVYLGAAQADVQREGTVGTACGTATSQHGFELVLTETIRKTYAGKSLYVYAIDYQNYPLLVGSGNFSVPN